MAMDTDPISRQEDAALVLRALVGDLSAFDELVRRYRGAALAVAQSVIGCFDRAQDVAQESFLLAFKALPQLEDPARFPHWLCAITRNRARRLAGGELKCETVDDDTLDRVLLERSAEIRMHPMEEMARRAESLSVRAALGKLPTDHGVVLRLYYYEEWPVKRIAEFLSLPDTTVKWRLHDGRRRLKRLLHAAREDDEDEWNGSR